MGWKITGPFLSDDERAQVATPGGLSGDPVETTKLLGPRNANTPRVFKADPFVVGLQHQSHIYGNSVPRDAIADRRSKNKQARNSRRTNRKAGKK